MCACFVVASPATLAPGLPVPCCCFPMCAPFASTGAPQAAPVVAVAGAVALPGAKLHVEEAPRQPCRTPHADDNRNHCAAWLNLMPNRIPRVARLPEPRGGPQLTRPATTAGRRRHPGRVGPNPRVRPAVLQRGVRQDHVRVSHAVPVLAAVRQPDAVQQQQGRGRVSGGNDGKPVGILGKDKQRRLSWRRQTNAV